MEYAAVSQDGNVVQFDSPAGRPGSSGGGNGGSNHGERLARIEAKMEHAATKEDIQKLRVWVLGGVLAGLVFAALAALGAASLLT